MVIRELNSKERIKRTNSCQRIRRGDIYWAYLGEKKEEGEQSGTRPVLIIQNNTGNLHSPTVIVSILSSKIFKCKLPTHVLITRDMVKGLDNDSFLATEQIQTISKKKLGDYIGHIENQKINRAISISLDLNRIENESESESVKIAKEKAEDIKQLDNFIEIWISGNRSVEYIKEEVSRRKIKIKDLQYYCEINKLNINEYYDVNCIKSGVNKNIRMVV